MARLNDTQGLTARPFAGGEEHSVSSRRIDNGYLVRTSTCNPETGEYKSSERFMASQPNITAPRVDGRQVGSASRAGSVGDEGLAGTRSYLGGKV